MLCWTSGFFVGFYNLFIFVYKLFIFVYKLFRIVLYNVYKEQIEYNHKVPYRNNRQCLG